MIKLKQILLEGMGDCYQAAGRLIMSKMNGKLVHGMVNGQGSLDGIRFGHAWVEVGSKVFDYSNIKKLGTYDKIDIYVSTNWQCADFKKICINKPKKNYFLENKNGYLFIKTTDRETF